MLKFKSIFFSTILLIGCSPVQNQDLFSKKWSIHYYDEEGEDVSSIGFFLNQRGDTVTGCHIIVGGYGRFLDYLGDEESIKGVVKDSVAIVTIITGRTAERDLGKGKAKLRIIEGDSLEFTLLEAPKGVHMFPEYHVIPLYKEEE